MLTRRDLFKSAALGTVLAAGGCGGMIRQSGKSGKSVRFRTIAYNVYACYGWTRDEATFSRRQQAAKKPETRAEMAQRFADALHPFQPDIITFSESPGRDVVAQVAGYLGINHAFFPSGREWPGALVTRFEIVEWVNCPIVGGKRPDDLFTRHWGKATVRAPFGDLVLHSAHLHPQNHEIRKREVAEILKAMKSDLEDGRRLILQGDLNHPPSAPEYSQWKEAGLVDCFAAAGKGAEFTIAADKPASRIDYIWIHGPLSANLREARVLSEQPFRPDDPSDPKSVALSDHLPVMATFGKDAAASVPQSRRKA